MIDPQRGRDGVRVTLAGGNTAAQMLHPSTVPFERRFRKFPPPEAFGAGISASNPFSAVMGSFQAPANMTLAIFNISANVFEPAFPPGNTQPVTPEALSNQVGFSLTIDGQTQGNLQYELRPSVINPNASPAFPGGTGLLTTVQTPYGPQQVAFQEGSLAAFEQARADSYANTAGPGNATQPQRPGRYGAPNIPFTLYAHSTQTVMVRLVIWEPITLPVAFFQYDIQGLLMPQNPLNEVVGAVNYPQSREDGIR